MKDIFLKLIFNILKFYMNLIMSYHFLPEKMKIEKVKKLVADLHDNICYLHENFKASIKSWISF